MTEEFTWYVARAGGLVAWSGLSVTVLVGFVQAGRFFPRGAGPWVAEVHRFLAVLTWTFTGVHLAALAVDDYVEFGLVELFVPMASQWRPGPVAVGVVALYLLGAIQLTSLVLRQIPRRLWRAVHGTSVPVFGLATVHGLWAGTDAGSRRYVAAVAVAVTMVAVLAVVRRRPRGGGVPVTQSGRADSRLRAAAASPVTAGVAGSPSSSASASSM